MVVLLVGIMTVIQMFPTGFRVVRAAESQTIATRLGQQELERWKNMADNLPTGILTIDENGAVRNKPMPGTDDQMPGPPFRGFLKDASGNWVINADGRYERGNALNVRQIIGETASIPVASYFYTGAGAQYGAKYTLAFSPIDVTVDVSGAINGITIKSGDLRRRVGDAEDAPPYLRAGDYAVDYTITTGAGGAPVFHVAFPKAYGVANRTYCVSYSYWASTAPNNSAVEPDLYSRIEEVQVAGNNGAWVPVPVQGVPSDHTLMELEDSSDTCARGFVQHTPGINGHEDKPWCDDDPYEFKLADPIVGVVAFNPTGHDKYEYTAQGIKPIQARIDYRVYDLRIIREDKAVPAAQTGATTIPIKLALRFILNIGDPTDNPGEETYQGLITNAAGGMNVPLPLLVIDLATGLRVDIGTGPNIDFKAGVVKLPIQAGLVTYDAPANPLATVPLSGRHLRFYYRADGDWSVQCNKAYASYARKWHVAGNDYSNEVDYHSYVVKEKGDASGLTNRLIFAKCEGLKSVVVDYTYITGDDGVEHKTTGEAHKIDFDTNTGEWCIDLGLPKDRPGAYIPPNGRIVVVGASFTVRVIWRDGKAWRFVDMDTNLTRD